MGIISTSEQGVDEWQDNGFLRYDYQYTEQKKHNDNRGHPEEFTFFEELQKFTYDGYPFFKVNYEINWYT